ncbi:MAG: SAM-dependent methyltransferase, partial [Thermoleophilia bacterium]|nr:SAM-dependent methyltransferase [Thermoleophilia bacterium]
AALAEARRVLKPDGFLVVSDIVAPEDPLLDTHLQAVELLRDPSHVRDYRVSEWRALLEAAGFEPGDATPSRPRMEFASWIARMRTPETHVAAIRALQVAAPAEVAAHFGIEADGSFLLDAALIEARPRPGR